MSKIKNFEIVTDGGIQHGQTIGSDSLMKAQEYAHQHVESATKLDAHYAEASGSFDKKPIFEGEVLLPSDEEPGGTVVRFNVPDTTQGVYLKVDGGIVSAR